MREGVLWAHTSKRFRVATPKRPAGRRQYQALDRSRRLVAQKLEQGRVLRVDRQHAGARRLGELHHELSTDDETLLVCESDVLTLAKRGDGWTEAGRTDEPVQD